MNSEHKPREFWVEHSLTDESPEWAVNDDPKTKQISGPREVFHVREVIEPDEITDTERLEFMINNFYRVTLCKGLWCIYPAKGKGYETARGAIDAAMKAGK